MSTEGRSREDCKQMEAVAGTLGQCLWRFLLAAAGAS